MRLHCIVQTLCVAVVVTCLAQRTAQACCKRAGKARRDGGGSTDSTGPSTGGAAKVDASSVGRDDNRGTSNETRQLSAMAAPPLVGDNLPSPGDTSAKDVTEHAAAPGTTLNESDGAGSEHPSHSGDASATAQPAKASAPAASYPGPARAFVVHATGNPGQDARVESTEAVDDGVHGRTVTQAQPVIVREDWGKSDMDKEKSNADKDKPHVPDDSNVVDEE